MSTEPRECDVIVVGAGVSGLVAARELVGSGCAVTVLEARERSGGRVLSMPAGEGGGLDLGPAWLWPAYQPRVNTLIAELGLALQPQYEQGLFRYQDASGVMRSLEYPARYADAVRVRGGMGRLVSGLEAQLPEGSVKLGTQVTGLQLADAGAAVSTAVGVSHHARAVVVAVPPPLFGTWQTPPLDSELRRALTRFPTWMAAQAKFAAVYRDPFWRDQGLSGSAVSHVGPLMEIVDSSDVGSGVYALFGFLGIDAQQRRKLGEEMIRDHALAQLARLFGSEAAEPIQTALMDWAMESETTTPTDLAAPRGHPAYGEPALQRPWFDERLVFAAAETAVEHGGLVEGAITAGLRAARQLHSAVSI